MRLTVQCRILLRVLLAGLALLSASVVQAAGPKPGHDGVPRLPADFDLGAITPPVIENREDWVRFVEGAYIYADLDSSNGGNILRTVRKLATNELTAAIWQRSLGDYRIDKERETASGDFYTVREGDTGDGYRVKVVPGLRWPAALKLGDRWEMRADLEVYDLRSGKRKYSGKLSADMVYEGARRVRTPAGEFDAVILREEYDVRIGVFVARDERLSYYARGVGLVAELESIRGSALMLFRMREDRARLLEQWPCIDGAQTIPENALLLQQCGSMGYFFSDVNGEAKQE